MTTNAILGTDSVGRHLAIRHLRRDGSFQIVVCSPDGIIVEEWPYPGPGLLTSLRFERSRGLALVSDDKPDNESAGIYTLGEERRWDLLAKVEHSKVRGLSLGREEAFWAEGDETWVKRLGSAKGEKLIAGQFPSLSPDRRYLYLRELSGHPAILRWPSLEVVARYPNLAVGGLSLWAPSSRCVVVERQAKRLELLGLDLASGTSFSMGQVQSWGTVSGCFRFIQWGVEGPARLQRFGLIHV
jgi:hypothetical protein